MAAIGYRLADGEVAAQVSATNPAGPSARERVLGPDITLVYTRMHCINRGMAKVIGGPCMDVMGHRPCAKEFPVECLVESGRSQTTPTVAWTASRVCPVHPMGAIVHEAWPLGTKQRIAVAAARVARWPYCRMGHACDQVD